MDSLMKRQRSGSGNSDSHNGKQLKKIKQREQEKDVDKSPSNDDFLRSLHAYIVKAGIEKARLEIFTKQVKRFGGSISESYDEQGNVSHIIVDDKMDTDRLLRLLHLTCFPKTTVVKSAWLSSCFKHKKCIDLKGFELKPENSGQGIKNDNDNVQGDIDKKWETVTSVSSSCDKLSHPFKESSQTISNEKKNCEPPPVCQNESDYEPSDDDDDKESGILSAFKSSSSNMLGRRQVNVSSWICAQSSKNPKPNCNSHITSKLEEMVKAYESTNDKWRAFGYQKAIQALRKHPKAISSWEEAKSLPAVGGRLADKIWEIAQSGELRKLTEFNSREEIVILQLFNNVWGAGPHTAQMWYQQGFRTIKDLEEKANLNQQQKVGVRLYDDLIERMPREEAGKIEKIVREAAESLLPGVISQACGSYRRGKPTCGDVDVLVTHPDGRSHKGLFAKLLSKLKESGFLTDDLVTAEDSGNQKKYLGVCKLPGENTKHRRLDIIVVPYDEYGCALVYFTGSAHFNRSLRHLCKKQNLSLNEHALKIGVVRKGSEKIHEGTVVPTPLEEDVFKALNVPFRPPEERDH